MTLRAPGRPPVRAAPRLRCVYLTDSMADVRMVEGLAERFDLTFVAPASLAQRWTWPPEDAAFRQALLRGGRARFLAAAWRWLVANRREYDVVIALDNVRGALAANAAALLTRRPVLLQVGRQTVDYYRCRGGRGRRHRAVLTLLSFLVAVNERLAAGCGAVSEDVAARCRRRARRVAVIPAWGVDPSVYRPAGSRAEARAALGLPAETPLVLYRSRLAPEKDPASFVDALARLRADRRDTVALYVGGEHEEFARLAAAAGIPAVSRGAVHPRRELPAYYRAADVCVQTSLAEGLGLSPLEALACGTPVVVSDVGGLREVAGGGAAGVLVPPRDAAAVARAIGGILDDPAGASAMAARGRAHVLSRYTPAHAFDAWEALAREVTRPRRSRGRDRAARPDPQALSRGMRSFWERAARENPQWYVWAATPYDRPDEERFWESGRADARRILDSLPARPRRLLEIGCGVGRMSVAFASAASTLYGVDISPEMLRRARRALDTRGLRAHLMAGDATDLSFLRDGAVDTVVSYLVLQHIPDPDRQLAAIREMARVLAPGGSLWVQVPTNRPGLAGSAQRTLRRVAARAQRARQRLRREGAVAPGLRERYWWRSAVDAPRLLAALERAGLDVVASNAVGSKDSWFLCRSRSVQAAGWTAAAAPAAPADEAATRGGVR